MSRGVERKQGKWTPILRKTWVRRTQRSEGVWVCPQERPLLLGPWRHPRPIRHGQFRENQVVRERLLADQTCLLQLVPKCLPKVTCRRWDQLPLKSSACLMVVKMSDRHKKGMSQAISININLILESSQQAALWTNPNNEPKWLFKPHICGKKMTSHRDMTDTLTGLWGKRKQLDHCGNHQHWSTGQAESSAAWTGLLPGAFGANFQ